MKKTLIMSMVALILILCCCNAVSIEAKDKKQGEPFFDQSIVLKGAVNYNSIEEIKKWLDGLKLDKLIHSERSIFWII